MIKSSELYWNFLSFKLGVFVNRLVTLKFFVANKKGLKKKRQIF